MKTFLVGKVTAHDVSSDKPLTESSGKLRKYKVMVIDKKDKK